MDPFIQQYKDSPKETYVVHSLSDYIAKTDEVCTRDIKIFHVNIRSLAKNLDELKLFLSQFREKFDVIVLGETFKLLDISFFGMVGYNMLYSQSEVNRNDGVVVYVREDLKCECEVVSFDDIRVMNIYFVEGNKKFLITPIYRPCETCPDKFNACMENYLKTQKKNYDYHVIVGDTNIDILSDKIYSQVYLNILSEYGYLSYINEYTRIAGESKSCIDHIFIKARHSKDIDHIRSFIFQYDLTDHHPVIAHLCFESIEKRARGGEYMTRKYINYPALKRDLSEVDWNRVCTEDDLNKATTNLVNIIKSNIDRNVNTVNIKVHKKTPWITTALLVSIKTKARLYKETLKCPNNREVIQSYKIYKNKLNNLIKYTKAKYYSSQINKSRASSKDLWRCVKSMSSKHTSKENEVHEIRAENGELIQNKVKIADEFNTYYKHLGEKLASQICRPKAITWDIDTEIMDTLYLKPTDENEVLRCINLLKNGKSPGYDGIRSEVLKEIANVIKRPLASLINRSFSTALFPDVLKIGVVKPVYKSGDKREMSNYRPISLMSSISKIFEMILKERINKFASKYNIISDNQYGFREGRSTSDAVANLTNLIYRAVDNSSPALCIFVDLAKAFDTVNHAILAQKLEGYGIRGHVNQLLGSYLKDRMQYIEVDGEYCTDGFVISCGVPQGTILGPLLFTFYINGLLKQTFDGTIISFADDAAVFYREDTWEGLKARAERDFSKIKMWLDYNLLTLNTSKTNFLTFSSYNNKKANLRCLKIDSVNSTCIKQVNSTTYLGVTIDEHLRWEKHVNNLVRKLRGLLYKFRYLKEVLDRKQLTILYYSLVQSQLSYGIIGWGGVTNNHLNGLEVIQKWFLKIIHGKKRTYPSEELYREARVFDIRQLFCYSICLELYKCRHLVTFKTHRYSTRFRDILCEKQRVHKTIGERSYNYLILRLHDVLPEYIRNATNIQVYKKRVKQWILQVPRCEVHGIIDIKNS